MTNLKPYIVTLTFQYPAWDEKDGYRYEVQATSKKQAIQRARWQAERDGHAVGGRGRYWFRAEEYASQDEPSSDPLLYCARLDNEDSGTEY
jgi:hypothetical protein